MTPSPLGRHWLSYVHHRLRMQIYGIAAYTTRKYTRLSLDKHIESNRAIDVIANKLTKSKRALIFLGNADTPPNSPIKIKKNVRCPGTRKLINAFKKTGKCVVLPVDEYFTSQTCAKCFGRFDRRTRKDKIKVCQDCHPTADAWLPSKIVTQLGKRNLQAFRKLQRARNPEISDSELLTKVKAYTKIWEINDETDDMDVDADADQQGTPHKTVWQRDIVAAKCILIKGIFND